MPLYATIGGQRQRATRDGPRRAACPDPDCGQAMIAKTGDVVIWHWAHQAASPHCATAAETEWHLRWKALGPPGSQERVVGSRRADVLAPPGFAVEFQRSALTAAEVAAREADWHGHLVWVFDARDAYLGDRLTVARVRGMAPENALRSLRWAHAPERVRAARCLSLLDLGGLMIVVGRWSAGVSRSPEFRSGPLRGYGWQVTRDWAVVHVLHGRVIPRLPAYGEPAVDFPALAERSRALARRLLGEAPDTRRSDSDGRAVAHTGRPARRRTPTGGGYRP